jgi:hypothetical protein
VDTVNTLTGIEIQTSVDKAEIYVGDLINYKITIIYDSSYQLVPPPLGANLGSFDVKDYQTDITSKLDNGQLKSENKFVLSTFTTGDYTIPPFPVIFNLPDNTRKALLSEQVPIRVLSLLTNDSDSLEIKTLKPQLSHTADVFQKEKVILYYWIVGIIVLIGLIFYLVWRIYFRKKYTEIVDLRPAWEIAFEKLALLKQKDYLDEKQYKDYYIELTEILRSFFEKLFKINVLDMTSEEFLSALNEIDLPDGIYGRTKMFLNHADLVKFAKFIPEHKRALSDYDEIYHMIDQIQNFWNEQQKMESSVSKFEGSQESSSIEEIAS